MGGRGRRRIEAYKLLDREEIEVFVVDLKAILYGEREENVMRKPFAPSEAVAIAKAVEEYEKKEARGRQGTRTDLQLCGKLPQSSLEEGKSKAKAAKAVGMSRPTLTKAVEAYEKKEAKKRQLGSLKKGLARGGNLPQREKGESKAKAAKAVGGS